MDNKKIKELISKISYLQLRRISGKKRLEKFPLWKRIIFFYKFDHIRNIMLQRSLKCLSLVLKLNELTRH